MIRKLALTAVAALYIFNSYAQDDATTGKAINYYVGVQANQLLDAIINLNSNSVPANNPYLIIGSVNSVKYGGWGVQGGFGYNYNDITNQLTPSNGESKINNVFYRGGICRKVMISKRFQLGYGLDYVGNYQLDQTFTTSVTNDGNGVQDSTSSEAVNKTTSWGWGAQLTLGFYITQKIILSTEATYYYMKSEVKENVTTNDVFTDSFDPSANTNTISASNTSTVNKTITFSLPVALFLVIKF